MMSINATLPFGCPAARNQALPSQSYRGFEVSVSLAISIGVTIFAILANTISLHRERRGAESSDAVVSIKIFRK